MIRNRHVQRPGLGATAALATLVLALAVPARSTAAPAPAAADTLLAVFDGGSVTTGEFAADWRTMPPNERPPGDLLQSKRAYLQRMVDRKLLAREALRFPVTLTPAELDTIARKRRQLMQNELFTKYSARLPNPTPEDLERFQRQKANLAEVRFISFPDWDMARSWRMRLASGTPSSALDALIERGGPTAPLADSFRFVEARAIPDTLATLIWNLRPGQFSEVHDFGGQPTLIQLRNFTRNPRAMASPDLTIEEEYLRRQYDRMRQKIRMDLARKVDRTFVEDAMNLLLRGYMAVPERNTVDSVSGIPTVRPNMPLPVFTAADTGVVIARTRDRELTLVNYLRYWARVPAYTRPEVRDRAVLEAAVDRVILEDALVELAAEEGMDKSPVVVAELAHMREGFALDHYFAEQIEGKVKVDEAALKRYFAAQPAGHYDDPETLDGRIILLDRRELADSVLALARAGAPFDELARTHSFDGTTAREGGKVVLQRGTNKNVSLEDAMFATTVGQVGGPEQTPEGWVIWKVESKTPGKKRTLAEAREWVERDYRIVESDRILTKKLEELRKKAKARVFEERVTKELGAGGEWGD